MVERRPASELVVTLLSSTPMLPKIQRELELMTTVASERIKYVI
jgi:hypothetical protein